LCLSDNLDNLSSEIGRALIEHKSGLNKYFRPAQISAWMLLTTPCLDYESGVVAAKSFQP